MAEELQKEDQNQPKGGEDQDTANADELLKNLKLKEDELAALKGNENLLNVITHSLEAKRGANKEAKEYREKLEQLEQQLEADKKAKLEKKGEFEKLYQETSQKLTEKDQKIKDALVKGELSRLAGQYGLAKAEYLRLLDTNSIEVDADTLTVNGADEVFKEFKENNPELFKKAVPGTDNGQPSVSKAPKGDMDKLKELEARAGETRLPRDLAAFKAFKRDLQAQGKL